MNRNELYGVSACAGLMCGAVFAVVVLSVKWHLGL